MISAICPSALHAPQTLLAQVQLLPDAPDSLLYNQQAVPAMHSAQVRSCAGHSRAVSCTLSLTSAKRIFRCMQASKCMQTAQAERRGAPGRCPAGGAGALGAAGTGVPSTGLPAANSGHIQWLHESLLHVSRRHARATLHYSHGSCQSLPGGCMGLPAAQHCRREQAASATDDVRPQQI